MTRSAQELRHESERRRADLAATVDRLRLRVSDAAEDIRHKVSSEHIRSEVADYVSHKTQGWVETLKQRATENPMQALAAGTAVALPLLRLARGFPLPLLMMGAGLALTSKKVRDGASQLAAPAVERAEDILNGAAEQAWALKDHVSSALSSAQSQVTDIANDAQDAAVGLADNLRSRAAQVTSAAGDRLRAGVAPASDTATAVKGSAATASAKVGQVIGGNATLIGGLGIAIGAIVAATFPETKVEANAMGQTSDSVKQLATETTQAGVKAATDATMSAADAAATSVAEADLGGHASRITQNIADTLKKGTDDVVRAALNTSQKPNT